MFTPVEDKQQSKEHTTQMSEVSHAVGTEKTLYQFESSIAS